MKTVQSRMTRSGLGHLRQYWKSLAPLPAKSGSITSADLTDKLCHEGLDGKRKNQVHGTVESCIYDHNKFLLL